MKAFDRSKIRKFEIVRYDPVAGPAVGDLPPAAFNLPVMFPAVFVNPLQKFLVRLHQGAENIFHRRPPFCRRFLRPAPFNILKIRKDIKCAGRKFYRFRNK